MNGFVSALVRLFVRWTPDAFVVAVLLSIFTFLLAVTVAGYSPVSAVEAWGDGFWGLLTFTNQITLTLLLGYAFANTLPIRDLLLRLAGLAKSAAGAYVLACLVTGVAALFSWGMSLITAGIMSRAIGESCRERGIRVHYPLLVASAFSGFVVWHQGLSSSVGLILATPGHFLEGAVGLIPTSQTIFTGWNVTVALVVLATMPFVMAFLRPRDDAEIEEIPDHLVGAAAIAEPFMESTALSPAQRLESSRALTLLVVAAGLVYLTVHFFHRGRGLELNILNFGFLITGMLLAGSPIRYMQIILEGGRVAVPFLLQYPFYAGIAGLMRDSGLAQMIVDFFVSISSAGTLPLFGLLSGGLLNLFIPSGGGQWAVQGPIMMAAAQEIGADLPRTAMSVALGDQWTNLVQPLAIVPVLTIAGLSVRQIMGYTFIALFWSGAIFAIALLL
jgi:short-chain fatty acids transporter